MELDSLRGRLLLASPALYDPNFRRTVVLVTEHTDEGAVALVLNRPSETAVEDAVPDLAGLVERGEPVYVGGPVQQSAVLVLAEFDDPSEAAEIVLGDVGFPRSDDPPEQLAAAMRRARVFAGYAGWGPGQLEAELEEQSWLVEPAAGVDLFPERGEDLWAIVVNRKGGAHRALALMPEDPSLN